MQKLLWKSFTNWEPNFGREHDVTPEQRCPFECVMFTLIRGHVVW